MKKLFWTTLALSVLTTVSQAQGVPQADVAVGYSGLYILKGYTIWNNGGSGSVAWNANNWFGVAGDFGGYVGHVPQTLTGETYLFGPRLSYRRPATSCHSPRHCSADRTFRSRLGASRVEGPSLPLPSEAERISGLAAAGDLPCGRKSISWAYILKVPSRPRYGYRSVSFIASAKNTNSCRGPGHTVSRAWDVAADGSK